MNDPHDPIEALQLRSERTFQRWRELEEKRQRQQRHRIAVTLAVSVAICAIMLIVALT